MNLNFLDSQTLVTYFFVLWNVDFILGLTIKYLNSGSDFLKVVAAINLVAALTVSVLLFLSDQRDIQYGFYNWLYISGCIIAVLGAFI